MAKNNVLTFPRTVRHEMTARHLIPGRLRDARKSLRLSQEALGRKVGVSRQSVSAYESGSKVPDPETFEKIIDALEQPITFFTSKDRPVFGDESPFFFRKRGPETERRNEACTVLGRWFVQTAKYIDEYVNYPEVGIPSAEPMASSGRYADDEIEDIANNCRHVWGLGPGPISNVLSLIESRGVVTCRYDMEGERVDAFSFWSGARPFIFMALEKESSARVRFDLAHELGHLVLHRWAEREELVETKTLKEIEREADKFASAFLLPKASFPNEIYTTRLDAFVSLKRRWKVSIQAMVYRCRDLGLIDDAQFTNLYKTISFRKWRTKEPLDDPLELPIEQPKLLAKAIKLLLESGVKHPDEICSDIGLSRSWIQSFCNLPDDYLRVGDPPSSQPTLK